MAEEDTTVLTPNQTEGQSTEQVNNTPDPGWISAVTKDLREAHGEDMKQHASINPILEDYYGQKAKMADAIFRPKEGATPEEVTQYNELMGIPPNVEGYELEAPPEGIANADFEAWFRDMSLSTNLSKDQAKGMYNAWNKLQVEASVAKKAETVETERVLRAELGSGYDAAIANATRIVDIGGEDFKSWLNESGAGNDPRLVRVLTKLGSLISEDSLNTTHASSGSTEKTLEERIYPDQGK